MAKSAVSTSTVGRDSSHSFGATIKQYTAIQGNSVSVGFGFSLLRPYLERPQAGNKADSADRVAQYRGDEAV